ncbi:MAG: helix-turn-helix domain-containing protein [Gaiellaceae bacterium MAG52_C11]|nr:helix-turn-helix domain-containing protein [Candidatus Gaiellasilicea maunaloa]
MRHRHLDVDPAASPADLGRAALDDLLERGDLDDWAPLLREIRRAPRGELADRVLSLVEQHPMVGTSALWRSWIIEQRAGEAAGSASFHAGAALRELRLDRGLTQAQLAARLETTQPEISKLERRRDVRISTFRAYVAALGGSLELRARFADDELDLRSEPAEG